MLCPKCQYRNSNENRFCGHCGAQLAASASTIYPREGYDEGELPPVSDDDSGIPRFRRDVPPLAQSEYGPSPDSVWDEVVREVPENGSRVVIAPTPEPPRDGSRDPHVTQQSIQQDVPVKTAPPSRESEVKEVKPEPPTQMPNFGSSTGILFSLPHETERKTEAPVRESRVANPVASPVEPERAVSAPPPARRSEGIHGPSFLGLADSAEPDFLDDIDEPESHSRRNWFLLALAIVIVLGIVQWRNIRDTGMSFAGSMKLNLPHKNGQPKPAETTATDNPSENGPANTGKPEMVVNPENKNQQSTQNNAQPSSAGTDTSTQQSNGTQQPNATQQANGAQQAGANPPNGAATSSNNSSGQSAPSASAKADKPAQNSAADNQPTQQAKNTAPTTADNSADTSDEDSGGNDAEPAAKSPAKSARTTKSAPEAKPAATSAGAAELAHANSAGSPETAAKWLWASTSKGNLDAPVRLADMYATGNGVPKDCEQATVLLRSSARRGNPRASARLGMYYATGQCVTQDRAQAWHWLALAHQRDPNSDWITQYRQRLWSEMSPDERARAGNGPMADASE